MGIQIRTFEYLNIWILKYSATRQVFTICIPDYSGDLNNEHLNNWNIWIVDLEVCYSDDNSGQIVRYSDRHSNNRLKQSSIQITIQITDHLISRLLLTIQIPHKSAIQISTVDEYLDPLCNSIKCQTAIFCDLNFLTWLGHYQYCFL